MSRAGHCVQHDKNFNNLTIAPRNEPREKYYTLFDIRLELSKLTRLKLIRETMIKFHYSRCVYTLYIHTIQIFCIKIKQLVK